MTFSRPYSGTFAYQGFIPSSAMNNINNDIPNCLDKTGDNSTNSGGVTGRIDWKSGSTLKMLSGSTFNADSGSVVGFSGTVNITHGTTVTAYLDSTCTFSNDTGTVMTLNLGNSSSYLNVSGSGSINLNSGGFLGFFTGSTVDGTINWKTTSTSAGLSQSQVSSGAGASMTIAAQRTTASGQMGGTLFLEGGISGVGANETAGPVIIQPFGSTAGTLVVHELQGSPNTQATVGSRYLCVCSTPTSGSNVQFFTLTMPNISGAFITVNWHRRTTGGSGCLGNFGGFIAVCNAGGTVTSVTNPQVAFSGGSYDANTNIVIDVATANTLKLLAVPTGTADDWQFVVEVNLS